MLTVEVLINSTWTAVNADEATIVRRFGRGGNATFRIPDATIQDRQNVRMHRRVRIAMTRGEDMVWFVGIITNPRVITDGPLSWVMQVECAELAEAAKSIYTFTELEYPQRLESLVQTLPDVLDDVYINESLPNNNFNNVPYMLVHSDGMHGLIKFDLSDIGENDRIHLASLVLRSVVPDPPTGTTAQERTNEGNIYIHRITEAWDEDTVTWNTRPSVEGDPSKDPDDPEFGAVAGRRVVPGDSDQRTIPGWDVTSAIRAMAGAEATDDNHGLYLTAKRRSGDLTDVARYYGTKEQDASKDQPYMVLIHAPGVLVTDVVVDLWNTLWPEVDTSQIQQLAGVYIPLSGVDEETGQAVGTIFDRFTSLFDATDQLRDMCPGYEWWLDTTDGDDIVLRFERIGTVGPGLTGADIGWDYEIEPSVERIRNDVLVVGPVVGGNDEEGAQDERQPAMGRAFDTASIDRFGTLFDVVSSGTATSNQRAELEARGIVSREAWEFWRIRFRIDDLSFGPGAQLGLYIPEVGHDGANFGQNFIVEETQDIYRSGVITRLVTARELNV